ncbi:MAG: type IV pilin-like G/H family protein [Crinalium sp.]
MLNSFTSSKLIIFRVILALLIGIPIITQSSLAKTVEQPPIATKHQKLLAQLLGKWQAQDPASGKIVTLVFTPKSQLFILLQQENQDSTAIKMGYKINFTTKPMQIDIIVDNEQKVTTIFELTQGKLHLELEGTTPGQTRPTAFSAKSSYFAKISNETTLPKNAQVVAPDAQANKPRKSIAEQYIGILNRAQQAYYLETGKFAADLDELGIITTSETEFYRYQIRSDDDFNQRVSITAQAKTAEFPSYTSVVFAKKINGKTRTGAGICVTNKPSTLPPKIIKISQGNSLKIECPVGSHLVP